MFAILPQWLKCGRTNGWTRKIFEPMQNGSHIRGMLSNRVIAILTLALICLQQPIAGQKKQKLEKNYREWLERDVAYIITKDEKEGFLRLTTNEARDKFIEDFWEIRNPNPGSPSNSYRDET